MKVFNFIADDTYCIAAQSLAEAETYFKEEFNESYTDVSEVSESEWDNKFITMYEDNNTENEPFKVSIRDIICGNEPQLIFTTDQDII